MNRINPTFGLEPTDDYLKTKQKLIDFTIAYNKLSSKEQERFAKEFIDAFSQSGFLCMIINTLKENGV